VPYISTRRLNRQIAVIPAEEAVSQLTNNIQQVFVIPGLTRNPAVFQGVKTMDAGSGSGMTQRKRVPFEIVTQPRKPGSCSIRLSYREEIPASAGMTTSGILSGDQVGG
jgi:hypothetical protein